MPDITAPQPIDWPGIRAASVSIGIRPAARRAASALPPDEQERFVFRVLKRAAREGWEAARSAAMSSAGTEPVSRAGAPAKELSSNVLNGQKVSILSGADAIAAELAEHRDAGTISAARATRRALLAAELADLRIETPADLLSLVKAHRSAHGLDQAGASASLRIDIYGAAPVRQVEGRVIDSQD